MTPSSQPLRAQRPTLAGTPVVPMEDLVRLTLEACEQAHDAFLQAVRQALRSRRSAPPLNEWLAGASLCRTLAEVLAVEASEVPPPQAEDAAARPALSRWAVGMAELCAGLCRELAAEIGEQAGDDESSRTLQRACESCVQACARLLADAGPPGGRPYDLTIGSGVLPPVAHMPHRLRSGAQAPDRAAA